jgi:hypothetical protein
LEVVVMVDSILELTAARLRNAFARAPATVGASSAAMDELRGLAEPRSVAALLESALRDDARAAFHAGLSYTHPLGFEKIILIDAEREFALRLHVWWPTGEPEVEHVHNHRFGFASVILAGGFTMRTFAVSPDGDDMVEYREAVADTPPAWQLERIGENRLVTASESRLGRGAGYALAAQTLHQIAVTPGTLCITMFLQTAVISSATRVFALPGPNETQVRAKRPMSVQSYRAQLDAVLAALTG